MLLFTLVILGVLAPGLLHAGSLALMYGGSPLRRSFWLNDERYEPDEIDALLARVRSGLTQLRVDLAAHSAQRSWR